MRMSDWSSDVCSSDLIHDAAPDAAGFQTEQRVFRPGGGIISVARIRNHVVVAAEHEGRAVVEQRLDTRPEPRPPAQLVRVLLGADGIAVRKIDRRDAKAAPGRPGIAGARKSSVEGKGVHAR